MKTLLEYLLLEAGTDNDDQDKHAPKGFNRVSLSGGLSDEAKKLLGFSSYKKARKVAMEKPAKIQAGLEFTGKADTAGPIKFCKTFFKGSSKLSAYISLADDSSARIKGLGGNTKDRVFLKLKSSSEEDVGTWKDVGGKGKIKSSIRVIRFWVESTMNAYLGNVKGIKFAYDEGANLFCVYKEN